MGRGRGAAEEGEVDAADQGRFGLAAGDALAGEVDGDEGGGLSGVDRHAGSGQPERVGDAVGDEAAVDTGEGVGADRVLARCVRELGVVVPYRAHEHAGAGPAQIAGPDEGVLQCLPGDFEGQPLPGVHGLGLAAGNAEEFRVERVDAGEISARAPGNVTGGEGRPFIRRVRDRPATVHEEVFERDRVVRSWNAAPNAHQSDARHLRLLHVTPHGDAPVVLWLRRPQHWVTHYGNGSVPSGLGARLRDCRGRLQHESCARADASSSWDGNSAPPTKITQAPLVGEVRGSCGAGRGEL